MGKIKSKLDIIKMKKDQYKKWIPLEKIPSRLHCEGLHDDYEGFRILLKGDDPNSSMLRITFNAVLVYRNIDEGDLLLTIQTRPDLGHSALFTVENSTWLEWFHGESCEIHERETIVHYAIYTSNDCIDVLSAFEPTVEWLNE